MWSLKIRSFQSVKHDTGVENLGPNLGVIFGLKIVPIEIGSLFLFSFFFNFGRYAFQVVTFDVKLSQITSIAKTDNI